MQGRPEDERPYVQRALEIIGVRVHNEQKYPVSPHYYVVAYQNLKLCPEDWNTVLWHVDQKNFSAADHREIVNALILKAERESKRTGRSVIDVFHELRQDPDCYGGAQWSSERSV